MRRRRGSISAVIKLHPRPLLVATHNKGKVAEYADILGYDTIRWVGLDEAGVSEDVAETGETFIDNAILKAVAYSRQTGLMTLADDSGLEVDALDGAPGVLTARYGGPGLDSADRYRLLLRNIAHVAAAERSARFRCAIALAGPDGSILGTAEGTCEGYITTAPAGDGGFGYDPVFYLPEQGMTMAQVPAEMKHQISHRGRAMRAIAPLLQQVLNLSDDDPAPQ